MLTKGQVWQQLQLKWTLTSLCCFLQHHRLNFWSTQL